MFNINNKYNIIKMLTIVDAQSWHFQVIYNILKSVAMWPDQVHKHKVSDVTKLYSRMYFYFEEKPCSKNFSLHG